MGGFEPPTLRLTVECTAVVLHANGSNYTVPKVGFEPTLPFRKLAFEASVSANSNHSGITYVISYQLGLYMSIIIFIPDSFRVRDPFLLLHLRHAATVFNQLVSPPFERGTM